MTWGDIRRRLEKAERLEEMERLRNQPYINHLSDVDCFGRPRRLQTATPGTEATEPAPESEPPFRHSLMELGIDDRDLLEQERLEAAALAEAPADQPANPEVLPLANGFRELRPDEEELYDED